LTLYNALRDPDEISRDQAKTLATILCRCPVVAIQHLARAADVSRPLAVRDLGARARVHGHLAPVDLGDTLPVVGLAAPDALDLAHRLVSRSRRLDWR
jgi:hypothetical protein